MPRSDIYFLVLHAKRWQQSQLPEELIEWTKELYNEFKVTHIVNFLYLFFKLNKLNLFFSLLFKMVSKYTQNTRLSCKIKTNYFFPGVNQHLGVDQNLKVNLKAVRFPFSVFSFIFVHSLLFLFVMEKI